MQSTLSLASRLQNDFAQFHFKTGDDFYWSPGQKMIFYPLNGNPLLLLHELGHALLGHQGYSRDVQLLGLERDAWEYTKNYLSQRYNIEVDHAVIENALDTYREWLHSRSICPTCTSTGIQARENIYSCVVCFASWEVNEARLCGLKRRLLTPK